MRSAIAPSAIAGVARRYGEQYAVLLAIPLLVLVFSLAGPSGGFFNKSNFALIASSVAVSMLVALGLTIPLASGDFDLSVGQVLGLSGAVFVWLQVNHHWSLGAALGSTFALAVGLGTINAILVVVCGLNALIATLASSTVFAGIEAAVLANQTVTGVSQNLQAFMLSSILGVPTPFIAGVAVAATMWFVHEHTPLGRNVTMTGEGREAARLTGIGVDRIRFGSFVAASVLSGVAGMVLIGQVGAADPTTGPDYTLPAFAAAFLGATTVRIGRFNPWGTVVAICLVQVGESGLQLLGLQPWVVSVFEGFTLLVAIGFARLAAITRDRKGGHRPQHQRVQTESYPATEIVSADVE